jgi:hypothetical protein
MPSSICGTYPDHWGAFQYVPARSSVVTSIRLYTGPGADGGVGQVALLDSVAGDASVYQPGAVLATGPLAAATVPRWDTATLDQPVMLMQGHVYFIAELVTLCSEGAGTSTVQYDSPTLGGPWSGPYTATFLVQVCP